MLTQAQFAALSPSAAWSAFENLQQQVTDYNAGIAAAVASQQATDSSAAATAQTAAVNAAVAPLNAQIATLTTEMATANATIAALQAQLAGTASNRSLPTTAAQEYAFTLAFGAGGETAGLMAAISPVIYNIAIQQAPTFQANAMAAYFAATSAVQLQVCTLFGHPEYAGLPGASQQAFWQYSAMPMFLALTPTVQGQILQALGL